VLYIVLLVLIFVLLHSWLNKLIDRLIDKVLQRYPKRSLFDIFVHGICSTSSWVYHCVGYGTTRPGVI